MDLGIYPTLTKTYILERISQEEIMSFYLGIPVETNKLLKSPLRKDNNPTCAFYYNNQGRLRFRDLSGHFWGDCFDVVAKSIQVDSKNKKAFQLILHTIAKDFKIHKYQNNEEVVKYNTITKDYFSKTKKKNKLTFKIVFREYNYHDDTYWLQFNINRNILSAGKVYPAREIFISRDGYNFTRIYNYSTKDPAYCYYGGKGTYNIDDWKIYYPTRKAKGEQRFHSNASFLQGKHLITGDKIGIVTKAYKDVLSFRSFGIQAVAPSAESVLLTPLEYSFLQDNFDIIVSCMDYDLAGIKMANLLKKTYNIQPIMFTNGRFNTTNFKVKDFAEYVHKYDVHKTKLLLVEQFNKLKEQL